MNIKKEIRTFRHVTITIFHQQKPENITKQKLLANLERWEKFVLKTNFD